VRPKFACYDDRTRWRRTVESFDAAIDQDKLWTSYLKHFTTADLNWMSDCFMKGGGRKGYIGSWEAINTAKDYMCLRWNSTCAYLVTTDDLEEINQQLRTRNEFDFDLLVRFIYKFQQVALSKDKGHGFNTSELHFLQTLFGAYKETGVKPGDLFALMEKLGHRMDAGGEEYLRNLYQKWNIQDTIDKRGCIPYDAFLYFVQKVNQVEDEKFRQDELDKVIKSGFKDAEVEQFRCLFNNFIDTATGEVTLAGLKEIFKSMTMPLTLQQTKEVVVILESGDLNHNGLIDFGEFLVLVGELFNRDFFGDIKTLTERLDASNTRRQSMTEMKEATNAAIGRRGSSGRRHSTVEMAMQQLGFGTGSP